MTDPKLSRRKVIALTLGNAAAIPLIASVPGPCEPAPAAQAGPGRGKHAGLVIATWEMVGPNWEPATRCLMRLADWSSLPDGDRPEACVSREGTFCYFDIPGPIGGAR